MALGTIFFKYHIAGLNAELKLNPGRQQVKKVGYEGHPDSSVPLTPSLTPIAAHLIHQPVLEILFMTQIAKATAFLQLYCHQPIQNDHSFSLSHMSASILSIHTATRIFLTFYFKSCQANRTPTAGHDGVTGTRFTLLHETTENQTKYMKQMFLRLGVRQ